MRWTTPRCGSSWSWCCAAGTAKPSHPGRARPPDVTNDFRCHIDRLAEVLRCLAQLTKKTRHASLEVGRCARQSARGGDGVLLVDQPPAVEPVQRVCAEQHGPA